MVTPVIFEAATKDKKYPALTDRPTADATEVLKIAASPESPEPS